MAKVIRLTENIAFEFQSTLAHDIFSTGLHLYEFSDAKSRQIVNNDSFEYNNRNISYAQDGENVQSVKMIDFFGKNVVKEFAINTTYNKQLALNEMLGLNKFNFASKDEIITYFRENYLLNINSLNSNAVQNVALIEKDETIIGFQFAIVSIGKNSTTDGTGTSSGDYIYIKANSNVTNASINELTSYKIIIPSVDSSSNSCELSVAGVFKDSEGNLGNNSTILSSDNTGRPVWKKINLDLISDGGIDYVGRFFNANANQPPIDTIIDITQGEIFNDYVNNKAPGNYSHAEGLSSYAIGTASHASGNNSAAVGDVCFAHGWNIIAGKTVNSDYGNYDYNNGVDANISSDNKFNQQFIVGRNNICNQNTIFAVGCGASSTSRKNVFEATSSGVNVDGTIVSTGDITSPNITDIDNRLTNLINEYNGDTSGKLNNIQFDGKNLLIDGYIKDINGVNPKNDQILSWDDVNGNLKWINCTAVESDKFKITESISSWYNTTINGVQVYSKDITHNFKNKNGDTFTDPRSIEVIAYNSENVRVYLSYKVYADDLNKITVYSPVNDNMFIIVKQI